MQALAERVRKRAEPSLLSLLAQHGGAAHADLLASFLRRPSDKLRAAAVWALSQLRGADVVDQLLPAFADPSSSVRETACHAAERLRDRRLAPALVQLLRDPVSAVRERAKSALEATEFYVDQTERWQRLLHGAGLQANTAAEALVQQTKPANDKRIRLAAIRGLGALGVKETLPLLIQLMQDPDPDIATAATTAVDTLTK